MKMIENNYKGLITSDVTVKGEPLYRIFYRASKFVIEGFNIDCEQHMYLDEYNTVEEALDRAEDGWEWHKTRDTWTYRKASQK
jgi:hypothetical protein